jgi:DNA-binding NarL/FixJ family response regulator
MSNYIDNEHNSGADLPPIQILLAESDLAEIERLKLSIDRQFQLGIKVVKSYDGLLKHIALEKPQLVILGKIDKSNYLDICKECYEVLPNLPIVLLSTQVTISDSFRQLVKTCGLTDVIPKDSQKLNSLLQQLTQGIGSQKVSAPKFVEKIARSPQPQVSSSIPDSAIAGEIILNALREIVTISNNYFGPLAQGNYWRKAHARIVDEFPFMQHWSADHFSKLDCDESIRSQALTDKDIQSLRAWVQLFIEECERIIVDFRVILNDSTLSPLAKDLLPKS